MKSYEFQYAKVANGVITLHLHIIAANLEDDDLEVERYAYVNAQLLPIVAGEVWAGLF